MLPKTRHAALEHRKRKRTREIGLILDTLADSLGVGPRTGQGALEIFEFGSGNGFQIPYLRRLGNVVASDIYTSEEIRANPDVQFVQCAIERTPFADARFDLIFSNHVIEHIDDCPSAFRELKRIGRPDCLYAFSVPTNVWLLLTIPAQYFMKLRLLSRDVPWEQARVGSDAANPAAGAPAGPTVAVAAAVQANPAAPAAATPAARRGLMRWLRAALPGGHGVQARFDRCYRSFRVVNWASFFREHGFSIVSARPLLLYGPSEWPIIPTTRSRLGLCSSVLFLMKKSAPPEGPRAMS